MASSVGTPRMSVARKLLTICAAVIAPVVLVSPAHAQVPTRNFGASGIFLDTITGAYLPDRPKWVRQPALTDLIKALGGRAPKDFGLSFNCAVERSGILRDCHTTLTDPDAVDGPALTRAIAPLLRLDKQDAQRAVDKEYRLTVDAALQTIDSRGVAVGCLRPLCISESLPPPPAPPQPQDPLVREQVKAAYDCFSAAWDKSGNLRFAADRAVRENEQQPPPEAVRQAVLDYVNSRTELKKCMAMLETTAHRPTITLSDRRAVDSVLDWMNMNYSGQTRFEVAILVGFIDKRMGEAQLEFPGDWP